MSIGDASPPMSFTCPACQKVLKRRGFHTHKRYCGRTIAEYFWKRVDKRGDAECWPWTGSRKPRGYGHIHFKRRDHNAHRVAYELHHGKPPPAHMEVMHTCDNPPCVNPAHLRLGTHTDNMRDAKAKGRMYAWGNVKREVAIERRRQKT